MVTGAGFYTFPPEENHVAGFVDSTVKDIDERLRELKAEVSRLEAARSALVGRGPGRPRGSRATSRRRARGRPSGRRRGATRATQALELVRSRPGITIPEIATEIKIEPNYLYRVMPRLEQEGQVKRDGRGWVPA
jgi:predicted Rossmann fold nucleotide-binding protein DprA/Smf involved in DNA uptake